MANIDYCGGQMDNEKSESGAPIFRHDTVRQEWEPQSGDSAIEDIEKHVEKHLGDTASVYHEVVSDLIHLDVLCVKPNEKTNNHWVLITSGMSDLPMNVPQSAEKYKYAELLCVLPNNWKIPEESLGESDEFSWPIINMKYLARYVHKANTWFCHGHSFQNANPPVPFDKSVNFCATLFSYPIKFHRDFMTLKVNENKTIHFYATIPLYLEEMNFKLKKGLDPLLSKFDKFGISEQIDVNRKNVALQKRWGLF